MNILDKLLSERDWLMADGATGTNLFDLGLQAGDAPELWNIDETEKVMKVYQGAVDAGSDIILTNSFGGSAARLKLHQAEGRVHELNAAAAQLARKVADAAGRPVVVAGSVGPTGELLAPVGTVTEEEAAAMFSDQIGGLMAGGADVIWVETISSEEELRAAAMAAKEHDAPWCGTMSFDTAGRTMMGVTAADMVALVSSFENPPVAFGANCGTGSSDLLRTVLGFEAAGASIPVIAKGNAGIPKYVDGKIHYDGTPELMGDYAVLAIDSGARIIGGCCGTRPPHLAEMKRRMMAHDKGALPSLETISSTLGGFSSDKDGSESEADAPKRQRRRRRA